uniref:Putative saccharopine dehydrogenase n=1 Tax=uncultured Poseidoniia archaeon TaxID=1697135 RepID=A0A1B1TCI0_9ARCH|nr:putative saccharopine dehydrogenase [uncultured Candidatus Thalassoarchaea sp.]
MSDVIALGCGLVGKFVIKRLIENGNSVTVVDLKVPTEIATLEQVTTVEGDVFSIIESLPQNKVVVNMLPGRIGDRVRPKLIESGHQIIDLAFTLEDPIKYSELAKNNNCSLLWDVGIAPGLSNMLVKRGSKMLGELDVVHIKVGGNPSKIDSGWSYMAPFSPSDVIEEYTRPARIIENNQSVTVPALSQRHLIDVEYHGKMEAFLTDGLRSIMDSIPAKEMKEFTVRWPGHIDKWITEGIDMEENELLNEWKFDNSREEFTWLEVKVEKEDSKLRWMVYDNGKDGDSSMARTTGLVTAACAILFLEKGPMGGCGLEPGIHPPENLSEDSIQYIIDYLQENSVEINQY